MASCPAQSSSSAFFVTVGRGLENFAADELRAKLLASRVEVIEGKVFFCANVTKDKLFSLKMVERAFVLVKKINSVRLPYHKVSGFRLLCKLALEDVLSWKDAVRVWKRFQVSAEPSLSHVRQGGAEICSHAADARKKCKSTAFSEDVSATKLRAGNEDTLLHCDAEEEAFQTDTVDLAQQRPPADIFPELLKENLSFRVSFRCSGRNSRRYNPQELGCQLGLALTREFGWKADLRKPQLEVIAHLNNEAFIMGFPLTRVSLANRSWCRSPGLRATVAHAVAVLAGVQSGAKVLDPMCGSGTILLEATMEWKSAYYIGADIDCSQLSSASRNIASSKQSIDLIKASVLALPLRSSSVDVIVCDMPFGRRFGRGNDIMSQTRSSLQEMIRVLATSGILVLLVSQTMSQEVIKMVEDGKCCQYKTQINNALVDITKWPGHARKFKPDERACGEDASRTVYVLSLQEVVPVSLGETEASIHKYVKIRHGEKRTS